jgi:hypothetical protein
MKGLLIFVVMFVLSYRLKRGDEKFKSGWKWIIGSEVNEVNELNWTGVKWSEFKIFGEIFVL